MSALVVEVDGVLLWSEGGRVWRSDPLCRDAGTAWALVDDAPGVGGRVLSAAEVSRLVAPHGSPTARRYTQLSRTDYEREEAQRHQHEDAVLERRRLGEDP